MRNLAFLALLTVSALALAGCSGDGGGDGDDSTSSSSSSSRSSSSASGTASSSGSSSGSASSTTSGSPANQAPTGSISVAVNGTNATFTLTGSDPDGDIVVWDLTFGDGSSTNGTGLPANATHTYASAGNYTANFTITDGTDSTFYAVALQVSADSGSQQVVYVADVQMFCEHCSVVVFETGAFVPSASLASGEQGFDAIWLEITPEMIGLPFTITSTGGDPDAVAMDGCNPDATQIEAYGSGPEAGIIPADTTCLVTWEYETPMSTITMTVG